MVEDGGTMATQRRNKRMAQRTTTAQRLWYVTALMLLVLIGSATAGCDDVTSVENRRFA